MDKLIKIEIWWHGPYKMEDITNKFNDPNSSFGLYQIYGTHNISGPNTLLYLGKACDQTFAIRLKQHDWTEWEASATEFFIGQLGGPKNIEDEEWTKQINFAERLLIYFCAPPYNTQYLNNYGDIHNTLVLNFDKINRLPMEVSTFYNDSNFWDVNDIWKEFT